MRTTVNLPDEALALARRKAAAEGVPLGEILARAVNVAYRERPRTSPRKRVALPVSKASGGLLPGVDLNSNAALADLLGERL